MGRSVIFARRPVDRDRLRHIRSFPQPTTREGAQGHHRQPLGSGSLNGGLDKPAADATAAESGRDAGVHKNQPLVVPPVGELGDRVAVRHDEAVMRLVVVHGPGAVADTHPRIVWALRRCCSAGLLADFRPPAEPIRELQRALGLRPR